MTLNIYPIISSFLVLSLSEIGDKTFIVATIMASKYSRISVKIFIKI